MSLFVVSVAAVVSVVATLTAAVVAASWCHRASMLHSEACNAQADALFSMLRVILTIIKRKTGGN